MSDFSFSVVTGSYNLDDDLFDMTLFLNLPVRAGYSFMEGDPKMQGTSPPATLSKPLNPVLAQGAKQLVYKASYLLTLTMELKQNKPGCP